MSTHPTRWTLIQRAAAGSAADREAFVRVYSSVIHAYLGARWRGTRLADQVEDACQEVLMDCLREDGALNRADRRHPSGFRAFLYGVVRNVARNTERAHARTHQDRGDSVHLDALAAKDDSVAKVFDQAWASAVMRRAAELQLSRAEESGADALRRHRLLDLRFGDNLSIRDIAARWDVEPEWLHRQYRQAREEFRRALEHVVKELQGGGPESVVDECRQLLQHFS